MERARADCIDAQDVSVPTMHQTNKDQNERSRTWKICRLLCLVVLLLVLTAWGLGTVLELRYESPGRPEWFVGVGSGGLSFQRLTHEFASQSAQNQFESTMASFDAEAIYVDQFNQIAIVPRQAGWSFREIKFDRGPLKRLGFGWPRVLSRSRSVQGFGATSHRLSVQCPFWCLIVCAFIPTAYFLLCSRRRRPPGTCSCCGYDLNSNVSGRCPECGMSVAGSMNFTGSITTAGVSALGTAP